MRLSAVCTVNGQLLFDKITDGMGVTIELENLGDAQLCQDIRGAHRACVEPASRRHD